MTNVVTRTLLPSQAEFVQSDASEVMFSGAFGAGKTRALCNKALLLALNYPGNVIGIFRRTLTSLRPTTLKTLLMNDGDMPPVIPQEYIHQHNKSERVVTLKNGSQIIYGGIKSGEGVAWINSLNLGAAMVDQAEEIELDDWLLLQGRLRLDVGNPRVVAGACNPRHPGHWIYQRFFSEPERGVHLIETNSFENVFLPDDYIQRMSRFSGPFYDRFVLGKWVGLEGLIYPSFNPTVNIIDRFPLRDIWRRWRTIDFGYTNPFVCLWACEVGADNPAGIPEGSIVIYREIYMSRRRVAEHADHIARLSGAERITSTFADHDAADRAEMYARGIRTIAANKSVSLGIQAVQRRLSGDTPTIYFFSDALVETDESLTIDPVTGKKTNRPKRTTDEFSFYRWHKDANKEAPIKRDDHGVDALRYLVMGIDTTTNTALIGAQQQSKFKRRF